MLSVTRFGTEWPDSIPERTVTVKQSFVFLLALVAATLPHSQSAIASTVEPIDVIEVVETQVSNPDDVSRANAELSNEAAAGDAVSRITAAMQLDLDIRLLGHTSVLIANAR